MFLILFYLMSKDQLPETFEWPFFGNVVVDDVEGPGGPDGLGGPVGLADPLHTIPKYDFEHKKSYSKKKDTIILYLK